MKFKEEVFAFQILFNTLDETKLLFSCPDQVWNLSVIILSTIWLVIHNESICTRFVGLLF